MINIKKKYRKIKLKISKKYFKDEHKKMLDENFKNMLEDILNGLSNNWKSIFIFIVFLFELTRKNYLYTNGIPLFVLNSESIFNIASYGMTIIITIMFFLIVSGFIYLLKFFFIREGKIYRFLEKVFLFSFLFILGLFIYILLSKPIGINKNSDLIYINDTYEVYSKNGAIEVYEKKSGTYYKCTKLKTYNDSCIKK